MHPDLQHRLLDEIRGRFRQLLVTTHSVELIASVDPGDILVIDRTADESAFATSLPAVQAAIDQIGGVHNLQLTRLWQADRFLLVEGRDVELLQVLERTLGIRPASIAIIPRAATGGWGGWSLAITSKLPSSNAQGGRIVPYAIYDRDYHTLADIDERYREADSRGVRLHIWGRKELENYLLVPDAIARHVSSLVEGSESPTAPQVRDKIVELAVELQDEIEIAITDELHKRDRPGGTPKAMKAAKRRVTEAYDSFEGVIAIVSGKEMIARLSKWTETEYGTTFGARRLVHELAPNEIDEEVRVVLQAIASVKRIPTELRTGA
jgi:hypothetical protein